MAVSAYGTVEPSAERPVRRAAALSVTGVAAAVVAATVLILVAAQPVHCPFPSNQACAVAGPRAVAAGAGGLLSRGPALFPAISPDAPPMLTRPLALHVSCTPSHL